MIDRGLYTRVWQELAASKAMVFMAGPRQVGKTTLAEKIAEGFVNHAYFNWDIAEHKRKLVKTETLLGGIERRDDSPPLVVFDEIHKWPQWKGFLKGLYDQHHRDHRFLVTGSGCLDVYQRGGDSLAGRYDLFHLWPLTLAELHAQGEDVGSFVASPLDVLPEGGQASRREAWGQLLTLSGFPEPFLSGRETFWRRWAANYGRQLVREDIRDLAGIESVQSMELLLALLPDRVGSPLSINSLAEDLHTSFNSVKLWIEALERFYLVFRISPWAARISRAIHKERKLYLFDTPAIADPGARFENAVALELHRAVSCWNDLGLGPFSLHYVRNKEKQEVDFLLVRQGKPLLLVEAKSGDREPSPVLRKFQAALKVPAVQLVGTPGGYRRYSTEQGGILVVPAWQWLPRLP